jgi:hypothetical protein
MNDIPILPCPRTHDDRAAVDPRPQRQIRGRYDRLDDLQAQTEPAGYTGSIRATLASLLGGERTYCSEKSAEEGMTAGGVPTTMTMTFLSVSSIARGSPSYRSPAM